MRQRIFEFECEKGQGAPTCRSISVSMRFCSLSSAVYCLDDSSWRSRSVTSLDNKIKQTHQKPQSKQTKIVHKTVTCRVMMQQQDRAETKLGAVLLGKKFSG